MIFFFYIKATKHLISTFLVSGLKEWYQTSHHLDMKLYEKYILLY